MVIGEVELMLRDCLDVFKEIYDKKGEQLIIDSYTLSDGSYVLVGETGAIIEILEITKDDITKTQRYYEFAEMDYLSKLVDMNKPIDPNKIIHSNNYLSFFVKKENVIKSKLTEAIIDNYYEILKEPIVKYKKSKDKEKIKTYQLVEKKYGKVDKTLVEKYKIWIKFNIFSLLDKVKNNKSYLKIFFQYDLKQYEIENEKYLLPNIYNNSRFNVQIDNITYGLPNDNMSLNSKKPFLENRTRKNYLPYIISIDEVILQKKFFDYLLNNAYAGRTNVYIGNGNIRCLSYKEKLDEEFSGLFLKIKKGKEIEIHDFDTIVGFNNLIKGLIVNAVIPIDYTKFKGSLSKSYGTIKEISKLKVLINDIYFNNSLSINYFKEPKDIKLNDFKIKENLIKSRDAFFNWFYKGNTLVIKGIFANISMELIKNSICSNYMIKAKEQFNLRCGILNYFIGDMEMADILYEIADTLRKKINSKQTDKIENDLEYYFAVGQISSYLLSLNKISKRMHSLINPLLNCKTDEKLRLQLDMLFKKYNYGIKKNSLKFNNFSAMVIGYQAKSRVNDNMLVAGYLYSSLIYERN